MAALGLPVCQRYRRFAEKRLSVPAPLPAAPPRVVFKCFDTVISYPAQPLINETVYPMTIRMQNTKSRYPHPLLTVSVPVFIAR